MRRFALIFGIVALVVIFAFVIALILWASVEKEDKSAPRWNKTEQLAERPNMMIDESQDQNAQAYQIGIALLDPINIERKVFKKQRLEWQDKWFNLAEAIARSHSTGDDFSSDEQMSKIVIEMNDQMESLDQEVFSVVVDAKSWDPVHEALKVLDGGQRATQTHSAIGVHQHDGEVHFVQIIGRAVQLVGWTSLDSQSYEYGKKAHDLINHYRALQDKSPILWSNDLHDIAYNWSIEQAKEGKVITHENIDDDVSVFIQQSRGMVGFAENVAMNTVQPISAAVDQVIEQWIKNEEQRLNIVGEFDYSAVAVSQKGSELYFNQLFAVAM